MRITDKWITNETTQAVCRVLVDGGYHALFVGGCVRNALLGAPVSDIDISTDARPETVMALHKAAGFKVVPTGIEHGTVTVIAKGIPHEITTFRHDVETDGRRAVIAFADNVADDARRRDFTMNALYADPEGAVIDPLGGMADLRARRVRFIEDPAQRIAEDYLRSLRFFRFHAWYGDPAGGLDRECLAAIADHLDGLAQLSRERVGAEMKKLLAAPDPAPAVAAMRTVGVLARVLPGAADRDLAFLVHLEGEAQATPDAIRRLACLGGDDVAKALRLSKAEALRLAILRQGMEGTEAPGSLGFHHGVEAARDICLLRATMLETALSPEQLLEAKTGADAKFPLVAKDLMHELSGPALGRRLKVLERAWIASGFKLSRAALLALPDE